MANERIVPSKKISTGGIQSSDLATGEIAVDEHLGLLVQKRADGTLDVYGKRGVATQQDITDAIAGLGSIGSGDMLKSTYDTDNDGKVDSALNADRLGGTDAADYSTKAYADASAESVRQSILGGTPASVFDTLKKIADELAADDSLQASFTSQLSNKIELGATIGGRIIA